jgi:hypothetical protein
MLQERQSRQVACTNRNAAGVQVAHDLFGRDPCDLEREHRYSILGLARSE